MDQFISQLTSSQANFKGFMLRFMENDDFAGICGEGPYPVYSSVAAVLQKHFPRLVLLENKKIIIYDLRPIINIYFYTTIGLTILAVLLLLAVLVVYMYFRVDFTKNCGFTPSENILRYKINSDLVKQEERPISKGASFINKKLHHKYFQS